MSLDSYPEIRSGTPDTILAGIWRVILKDFEIDPARLDDLVNSYSRQMTHLDAQKRAQYYGNVLSDLRADQMTWRTFRRGPMILKAKSMTIKLTLHHLRCQTEHKMTVVYGPPNEPEEKPDENGHKQPTELSIFFSNIMNELGVSVSTFNSLLTTYMRRMRIPVTPSNRTYIRGNFKKEFTGLRLSWASFVRGIDFLTVPSFDIEITLEFQGRRSRRSIHKTSVVLNDIEDMLADMDESEFLQPSFYESEQPNDAPKSDDTGEVRTNTG